MVWYQKFEYAISHWLQKATEHMIGCVLCSPGCFSLFRASALMAPNVMHKYTTVRSEAIHYVQYDQGEDRWLCTLLLQKGWRVEYSAASDAYTHCPESFGEFYSQRRRWGPSTIMNILDLLRSYKTTVKMNENISTAFILYEAALLLGTILSPATIFLMVIGSTSSAFNIDNFTAFMINAIPVLLFILICFYSKDKFQMIIAQIFSTLYALLMLAVFVSTGLNIANEGFFSPSALFFISIIITFVVAAILHPQEFLCVLPLFLYLLCIPSMYLLLTIYSTINLHVVSWGTREVKAKPSENEAIQHLKNKNINTNTNIEKMLNWLPNRRKGLKNWGLTCMCCSEPKDQEDKVHLIDIKETLRSFNENIVSLKSSIEKTDKLKAKRMSFIKEAKFSDNLEVVIGMKNIQDDEDDENDENDEQTSLLNQEGQDEIDSNKKNKNKIPKWAFDLFKKEQIDCLPESETLFWEKMIDKYLAPLKENKKKQDEIKIQLIDLRNQVVFAFGMINALFILLVMLLQMHKGVYSIPLVIGYTYNYTGLIDDENHEIVLQNDRIVKMDPIGFSLILLFGLIIFIQFCGMLLHRFGTLAHLLAFVSLDCCLNQTGETDQQIIDDNAVEIAKELQKLNDTDDIDNQPSGPFGQVAQQDYRLDVKFRRRLMSMKNDDNLLRSKM